MGAIVQQFLQSSILFVGFLAVCVAGVLCGKKFRDKKDAKKAKE
ncbi:hypothetical protein [Lachnoclostridium sp. An14]|nr:hypothetical protein [Lachnoclostridium sp. An14]